MLNRRGFLKYAAAASADVVCVGCGIRHATAQPASAPGRREITVGGRRVKTMDMHTHYTMSTVLDIVKNTPFETPTRRQLEKNLGFPIETARIADMDKNGIDVQVLNINTF